MSDVRSHLRRVASASGIYAAGAIAQRGLSFILLPIYTRHIEPAQYGVLELLSAFSSIVFLMLILGLDSAINKTYHRDVTVEERGQVLPTALVLSVPVLLVGSILVALLAEPLGVALLGRAAAPELIYLSVANGLATSLAGLFFAAIRAREAARAFAVLSLLQMATAMTLNIALVVKFDMGIRGVLWGNLISYIVTLPLTAVVASRGATPSFRRELVRPMLTFGVFLIPSALATWVVELSDRYFLRLFVDLAEVAIYGVGYKIGMLIQLVIVWPFQLSWPAVSFAISHDEGHRKTYARVLTYLVVALIYSILGLSFLSTVVVPLLLDARYQGSDLVVPVVTLAYAFYGIYFCVSPGIHIAGYTRYVGLFGVIMAIVNLTLNLLLIPSWGMMGAAAATALSFATLTALTAGLAQRVYPVPYEYPRLAKAASLGVVVFAAGRVVEPSGLGPSLLWFFVCGVLAFPLLLVVSRFFDEEERLAFRRLWGRIGNVDQSL